VLTWKRGYGSTPCLSTCYQTHEAFGGKLRPGWRGPTPPTTWSYSTKPWPSCRSRPSKRAMKGALRELERAGSAGATPRGQGLLLLDRLRGLRGRALRHLGRASRRMGGPDDSRHGALRRCQGGRGHGSPGPFCVAGGHQGNLPVGGAPRRRPVQPLRPRGLARPGLHHQLGRRRHRLPGRPPPLACPSEGPHQNQKLPRPRAWRICWGTALPPTPSGPLSRFWPSAS
jgi:hypothetical protein